jgi:allantoicase
MKRESGGRQGWLTLGGGWRQGRRKEGGIDFVAQATGVGKKIREVLVQTARKDILYPSEL